MSVRLKFAKNFLFKFTLHCNVRLNFKSSFNVKKQYSTFYVYFMEMHFECAIFMHALIDYNSIWLDALSKYNFWQMDNFVENGKFMWMENGYINTLMTLFSSLSFLYNISLYMVFAITAHKYYVKNDFLFKHCFILHKKLNYFILLFLGCQNIIQFLGLARGKTYREWKILHSSQQHK